MEEGLFQRSSEPGCSSCCPQRCWVSSMQGWAITWLVDLGNRWAGQKEAVFSSSFECLGLSLPLLFQENLLQDLSSSGCLTMRAAHALCAGMRVTGCNTELVSLGMIPGLCVCLRVHGNTWLGCFNVNLLGLHFILLLVFCGHNFKIVTIILTWDVISM